MVRGIKKNQLKSIDVNDMHENLLLIRYSVSTVLAKKTIDFVEINGCKIKGINN